MSMSDTISDMLSRIRNAQKSQIMQVDVPFSRIKMGILGVLKDEGYIDDYHFDNKYNITVNLKYVKDGLPVIQSLKRISKPGRRVYSNISKLARNSEGLGVYVISTSQGIMSDRSARAKSLGGEIICSVF